MGILRECHPSNERRPRSAGGAAQAACAGRPQVGRSATCSRPSAAGTRTSTICMALTLNLAITLRGVMPPANGRSLALRRHTGSRPKDQEGHAWTFIIAASHPAYANVLNTPRDRLDWMVELFRDSVRAS